MYEDSFEKLEEDYSRLIHKFIQNKFVTGYEKEDLYQECLMILDNCNKTFDPDIGVKFSTFFYVSMRNRISNLITTYQKSKRPDIFYVDTSNPILINTPSEEDIEQDQKDMKLFATLVVELLKYPRGDITYKMIVLGKTQREVAEEEGISKQRVSYINKRNINQLKNFLNIRGLLSDD